MEQRTIEGILCVMPSALGVLLAAPAIFSCPLLLGLPEAAAKKLLVHITYTQAAAFLEVRSSTRTLYESMCIGTYRQELQLGS